jgi:amino acid permease
LFKELKVKNMYEIMIFSPIIAVITWFIVSLVMFIKTPKDLLDKRKQRRTLLIVSSCVFGTMMVSIIAFIILLYLAIAHM